MDTSLLIILFILLASSFIYLKRYLTFSGTFLTAIMAIVFFLHGGFPWLVPPLTFFILSTLWTKLLGVSTQKDKTRKFIQVFANGGLALILVSVSKFINIEHLPILFTAVFASAAADTWATEFGGRFGGKPYSLRTFKQVKSGESGAISFLGTLASVIGAFSVSTGAFLTGMLNYTELVIVTLSGFMGSFADSLVGAWIQVIWINDNGNHFEEVNRWDNNTYIRYRGLSFVNNDAVNFLSTCAAVVVTLVLIQYFR